MSEEKNEPVNLDVTDMRTHQRWLVDNGFINDMNKDQLYLFGAILHKDVQAVELSIDKTKRVVRYQLFMDSNFFKTLDKFKKLSQSKSLFGLWRFKNMLKKVGNLNFASVINVFVKDYCGSKWSAKVEIMDIDNYEDGYPEEGRKENNKVDKQSND